MCPSTFKYSNVVQPGSDVFGSRFRRLASPRSDLSRLPCGQHTVLSSQFGRCQWLTVVYRFAQRSEGQAFRDRTVMVDLAHFVAKVSARLRASHVSLSFFNIRY